MRSPTVYEIRQPDGTVRRETFAEMMAASATVFGHFKTVEEVSKKRADVIGVNDTDLRRSIITDPSRRADAIKWETPQRIESEKFGTTLYIRQPLQRWQDNAAMLMYVRIVNADDGEYTLDGLDLEQLARVEEMQQRKLVYVDSERKLRLLSQPATKKAESYPGAAKQLSGGPLDGQWVKVGDDQAKQGRQLRDRADGLVLAALHNLMHTPQPEHRVHKDGIAFPIHDICAEANRLKSERPDLREYKFLHVETCRLVVKRLIEAGMIAEAIPPQRVYLNNQWHTIPRVYAIPDGITAPAPRPAKRKRERPGTESHQMEAAA